MKVKRFCAPTMHQALRMVREEMGADAVILSNRRVDGGVEIVTALDYDEGAVRSQLGVADAELTNASRLAQMQADKHCRLEQALTRSRSHIQDVRRQSAARQEPVRAATLGPAPVASEHANGSDGAWSEMRAEIHSLREMLQQQIAGQGANGASAAVLPMNGSGAPVKQLVMQRLAERLRDLGLERSLADELAQEHGTGRLDLGWKSALKALAARLQTESTDLLERGGICALVGPTGSGKTTTIGKMAARFVLRHGAEKLALVTTDRYRVAAHEQLFVFGRILNVPVRVVDDSHSLDQILDELSDRQLVLIDSAGLTASDRGWQEQVDELLHSRHAISPYLVISATSQPRIMQSTWHCYNSLPLTGCIMTKLDEALTLGEVIGFAVQSSLPVAYYTNGQKIPQDMHRAGPASLVKQAVRRLQALSQAPQAMIQGA
ncbi:MAG: flagellar biosynthesis protein FlhF [Halomonadaceae bacterium]|nr:MAG: flagellar biosynthesis protein FlhF [Halomonadaceae bacterium]